MARKRDSSQPLSMLAGQLDSQDAKDQKTSMRKRDSKRQQKEEIDIQRVVEPKP